MIASETAPARQTGAVINPANGKVLAKVPYATAADIDRVSQSLDFKGRIKRENWVEQARILASGGATEFSRRVDRGAVETSRYKS